MGPLEGDADAFLPVSWCDCREAFGGSLRQEHVPHLSFYYTGLVGLRG